MRMRLFEVMQAALGTFRYGPTVSCQKIGIYLDESLANNRDKVGHPDAQGRRTRTAMLCIPVAYRTRRSA
jgi:hypothetical protein